MVRQVLRVAIILSLSFTTVFFINRLFHIPKTLYQSVWYYGKATFFDSLEEKVSVENRFLKSIGINQYNQKTVHIEPKRLEKICKSKMHLFSHKIGRNLMDSIFLSLKLFAGSILFFLLKGITARRKKHVQGQRKIHGWQMALRLWFTRNSSPFNIGPIPLVKGSETRHILVSGGTGSGKTNCFHSLLPQIRQKGQRAVIVDTTGEFVSKYYREGKDILLNPFDARSRSWHPWIECRDPYDYKSLAQSFIPSANNEEENFWRKSAQEVFCSILQTQAVEQKLSTIVQYLLYEPLHVLSKALQNTKAAPFLDPSSEKTSGSIRAVAASFLECLELFEDTKDPFSIRGWVQNENEDSWLFLSSTPGQRASLVPLMSTWFSIAMRSLLQMEPDLDRRLWFVADEFPSLNRLKDIEVCLTESRKFGGCALLALQSPAQLEMIYGRELTRIILGNCATRIAFSEHDPEIAARISKTFGEKESREFQESISYGAHEMRDGVNLSSQSKTSPVVSATELQSLKTHQAFIKLPGNLPISTIELNYQEILPLAESFVKKGART
jgi:type IV conjugative transfer system coupling protein TraD